MITPEYVRVMAAYNSEMNRRLYAGADQLTDAQRREDRGLFWRSLHGTLNHLLWGDRQWMSRFSDWPKNTIPNPQSPTLFTSYEALKQERVKADASLEAWAAQVDDEWLRQDLVWFSGAAGREMRKPKHGLLVHFFNHQTHHRGQVHAALTGFGIDPGDTDLFLVVPGL
jgi:uncharacterized damage-inducible protein DinB